MNNLEKIILYLTIIISGASIMIFELLAPRLLAPFFGTSSYIWTIVIGIVMSSLALGYFLGGKIADKRPLRSTLAYLYIIAGIITYAICLAKDFVIYTHSSSNIITGAFTVSIYLLAPISIILGMVTPVAVRLCTGDKNNSGTSSGNIYALSTIGSIIGTFNSGFWIIPNFKISDIIVGISFSLLFSGLLLLKPIQKKIIILFVMVLMWIFYTNNNPTDHFANFYQTKSKSKIVADIQTKYSRAWIHDRTLSNGLQIRTLSDSQSVIHLYKPISYTMQDNLSYYSYFNLGKTINPDMKRVLMIGGGAYTYARYMLETYKDLRVDVVEIDPALQDIATKYFDFKSTPNFTNIEADGRIFINSNSTKYDAIYLDAYAHGASTPFQLLTKEAMLAYQNSLSDNGILFINVISSLNNSRNSLLRSQFHTARSVFENVQVFPVFTHDINDYQNIVLMARDNNNNITLPANLLPSLSNPEKYLSSHYILTDEYAPTEYLDFQDTL